MNGDPVAAFERALWLWFFLGIVHQRWRDRKQPLPGKRRAGAGPLLTPPPGA